MEYHNTITGIIEVDSEGIPHCGDIGFSRPMAAYKGCQCTIQKYFDNTLALHKYPFSYPGPDTIEYSKVGFLEMDDDGKLHVGKYIFPVQTAAASGLSEGVVIRIQQIHPTVKKGTEYFGVITRFELETSESGDEMESGVFFLFDTNVFIDVPDIINKVGKENRSIVVSHVITELDGLKKADSADTRLGAQRACDCILDASRKGRVKFVSTHAPYGPFGLAETMDQRILAAAFLKQFKDATVVLISSDKNMLLLAESNQVQAISLEDFLLGNYTIKEKESPQKAESVAEPDIAATMSKTIYKPTLYKENLEKDLAKKFDEYGRLFDHIYDDGSGIKSDSPFVGRFRESVRVFRMLFQYMAFFTYDWIVHAYLFYDWDWQELKETYRKQGYNVEQTHTAEEVFSFYITMNPDIVDLLFSKLDCTPGHKKKLLNSIHSRRLDPFIETYDSLSCDLSLVNVFADYVSYRIAMFLGGADPKAFYDYFFHSTHNPVTESARSVLSPQAKELIGYMNGDKIDDSVSPEKVLEQWDLLLVTLLDLGQKMIADATIKHDLFPFEKKYIDDFYAAPILQPLFERLQTGGETYSQLFNSDESKEESSSEFDLETIEGLYWPTDEEFKKYKPNFNETEFFQESIFGLAGAVKASDIEKLFNVLVAEKIQVLENDLETKLCFLARYSGRRIPHLELKPIEWKMLGPDRAKALGYLIKETAASDYATGVRFFYFDKDGEEIKPDRGEVATGAHQFAKPERQESTRTAFEKALNEFLAEYRGEE